MQNKSEDPVEIIARAFKESNGETVDLIVENKLPGVTLEMLDWFFVRTGDYYTRWHPEDHVSFRWEVPPTKDSRIGSIRVVEEKFGNTPVCKLRMRIEEPSRSPFGATSGAGWVSILGPDDEPIACSTHQYTATSYGTKERFLFRLPSKTPEWLIDAIRQHSIEEMGELPKFLPELYKKENAG